MAATLRAEVNGGFYHLVADRLDAADRARLAALLVVDPASRQSTLPALTRPAPRATVSRLRGRADRRTIMVVALAGRPIGTGSMPDG